MTTSNQTRKILISLVNGNHGNNYPLYNVNIATQMTNMKPLFAVIVIVMTYRNMSV